MKNEYFSNHIEAVFLNFIPRKSSISNMSFQVNSKINLFSNKLLHKNKWSSRIKLETNNIKSEHWWISFHFIDLLVLSSHVLNDILLKSEFIKLRITFLRNLNTTILPKSFWRHINTFITAKYEMKIHFFFLWLKCCL